MTSTERFVWKNLRNNQIGFYFRRQHRLEGFVLDFYCHKARLCIEIDGEGHQSFDLKRDRARDDILKEVGILTLRFRNEEIAYDWSACAARIQEICIERSRTGTSNAEDD